MAKSYIGCPIPECGGYLEEGLVISHLADEDVAKYRYFLELSQLDSSTKPCPQCSRFTSLKGNNPNPSEHKYKVSPAPPKHEDEQPEHALSFLCSPPRL